MVVLDAFIIIANYFHVSWLWGGSGEKQLSVVSLQIVRAGVSPGIVQH